MTNRKAFDLMTLQRSGFNSLDEADRRSYMTIQKQLREEPFWSRTFMRSEMGRVYSALMIDDPLFYVPGYRPDGEEEFFYDPVREYAGLYWMFLRRIYDELEDEPRDLADSIGRMIPFIADLYRREYSEFLDDCCIAKGIQYMCNLYGIECDLYSDEKGALYAGYAVDEKIFVTEPISTSSDLLGFKMMNTRFIEAMAPVLDYLERRGYSYSVGGRTIYSRTVDLTGEGVIIEFKYRAYFDSCIVKVFIHPRLKEKFRGELEKKYMFGPGDLDNAICWEKDFSFAEGAGSVAEALMPFLPEWGLPQKIADQLEVFKLKLKAAKECYESEDREELAELIDETTREMIRLDDMCEAEKISEVAIGKSPAEFYDLVMKIENDQEDE